MAGALADALAFAHEGRPAGPAPVLAVGSISDDTQLTLATCRALAEDGEPTPERIAEHLVRWHREVGFTGLGAATAKAIRELGVGGHWALVGRKGEMAAGNGAAVRVAPLAFVLDLDRRADRQRLRDICRITHHSDEAYVGALAIALTVRAAWTGRWTDRASLFTHLLEQLPDTRVRDRLHEVEPLADATTEEVAAAFGASGYVVESVPLAIHAFCASAESDFVEMVRSIVAAGGDCDSTASMAAQSFGALRGEAALPHERVANLDPIVDEVVVRLVDTLHRRHERSG